jgi:ligand-binding SRPBCC domain-containing protein
MIYQLHRQQVIPASLGQVWDYFADPLNLNTITPPNMNFEILWGGDQEMYLGQLIEYRVQFMPLVRSRWLTEITHLEDKRRFVDEQRIGPYAFWYHEHWFEEVSQGTRMTDRVTYKLPFGLLGELVHRVYVRPRLKKIFDYRFSMIDEIFI